MTDKILIRKSTLQDTAEILALYPLVFPEEELRPVVSSLLRQGPEVLSLAGFDGEVLVAHVLFTICGTGQQEKAGALLGPLGVMPARQRQGLGNLIVHTGLDLLEKAGVKQVFVLGDPAYYQRFGFLPERRVLTPYPIPDAWADAWQSMPLAARAPLAPGQLFLPEPWMNRALWQA